MGFSTKKGSYDEEYTPIVEAWHACFIVAARRQTSRNGKEMMELTLQIIGEGDPDHGRRLREYVVLQATSWGLGKLLRIVSAIQPSHDKQIVGIDDDPEGLDPWSQDSLDRWLLRCALSVKTVNEDYQNNDGETRTRTNADDFRPLSKGQVASLKSENNGDLTPPLPNLDSRSRNGGRSSYSGGGSSYSGGGSASESFTDDEIPF